MYRSRLNGRSTGTTIAEVPLGLWIIFIGIGLPLFALATITIRFALFYEAAREAVQAASCCQTYFTDPSAPATSLSAVHTATNVANNVVNTFSGLTINSVQLYIVTTPVSSNGTLSPIITGPNTPLSSPANPDQNMYQIQVVLSGQVQPLVTMPFLAANSVPGLTGPFQTSVTAERVFENPDGLVF